MTKAQILLVNSGWHSKDGISVKGSAFHRGALLNAADLRVAAQKLSSECEFISFIKELNGFFAIIIEKPGELSLAVDAIRSIPLFYSVQNGVLYLSDDAETIHRQLDNGKPSSSIRCEFKLAGYVTGSDTLSPVTKQLQSGECLIFRNPQHWRTQRYFSIATEPRLPNDKATLWEQLDRVFLTAVERLAHWAGGRTIVVPLSGGYDSRILAVLLRQIGYDKLIAYTYGQSGSAEVALAQEVARFLGIECRFVEYSQEAWWRWFHSSERESYFRAAHNLVSIPHIQDWPAIWTLNAEKSIPYDSVIVPGHTGDFITGGHIPKNFWESPSVARDDFITEIFQRHYTLWQSTDLDAKMLDDLNERIKNISDFGVSDHCSSEYAISKYEAWEWQERQAKFIVNSVRAYEFWGYEWWLPFYDVDVVNYWFRVPLEWRVNRRLYREYVAHKYAKIANLSRKVAIRREPKGKVGTLSLSTAPYVAARFLFHRLVPNKKRRFFLKRRLMRKDRSYDRHELAIYGIMDRDTFNKYRNEMRSFHSFVSKFILEKDCF